MKKQFLKSGILTILFFACIGFLYISSQSLAQNPILEENLYSEMKAISESSNLSHEVTTPEYFLTLVPRILQPFPLEKKESNGDSVDINTKEKTNPEIPLSLESLHSKAAYLVDFSNGTVIYAKNETEHLPQASLTKLMTVYLVLEHVKDLDEPSRVLPAVRKEMYRKGASVAGLMENEEITVRELLYATMLPSGSEAAGSLALHVAPDERTFVEWMNAAAEKLGLTDTHYKNPIGLDEKGHYSSARDVSLLLQELLKNPDFFEIYTAKEHIIPANTVRKKPLRLESTILPKVPHQKDEPFHILGGKSGTTYGAGLCWSTLAQKNGTRYLLVTMGAPLDNIKRPTTLQKEDALYIYSMLP